MPSEASAAAAIALGVGIALALVVDLGGPKGSEGQAATTAPSAAEGTTLAERMQAQTAAGAPGVALALEEQAPIEEKRGADVAAAHALAQFELGDAPAALQTVKMALRICDVTGGCPPYQRMQLQRLDVVIGAVVAAGVVDPKKDPKAVDQALHGLMPGAGFVH